MIITELIEKNVKRIKAVQVNPETGLVYVGGKNGQGKSSFLDGIVYAISGGRDIPFKVVRDGEDQAEIKVTLAGETETIVIDRVIKAGGQAKLVVKRKVGDGRALTVKSPQKFLDSLFGSFSFDPLAFTRLSPSKQLDMLKELVDTEAIDGIDADIEQLVEERTVLKTAISAIGNREEVDESLQGLPEKESSISDLLSQLESAQSGNRAKQEQEQEAGRYAGYIGESSREIKAMETEIANLRRIIEESESSILELEKQIDATDVTIKGFREDEKKAKEEAEKMPSFECDPIRLKIDTAEETNAKIRERNNQQAEISQRNNKLDELDALQTEINDLRDSRYKVLDQAKWPVDGLGISERGVTYQKLPFENCSSAEQLRISTAIGLSQNPELKVMLIHDGSLLDSDSRKMIAEMAEEANAQVWIEVVEDNDECTVVIEDGQLKQLADQS